ncbi:MAG: TolC family protein [Alistipes sp.]
MKRIVFTIAALATVFTLTAQEKQLLSLDEALSITLTNNPAVAASQYEERAAEQERRAAIGLRMPQINVTGAYSYLGKDIGVDLNDMKQPAKDFAGNIFQSGLIPGEFLPKIQQLTAPLFAADWTLPLQKRSFGTVGGEVTLPIWLGGKINAANRAARLNQKSAEAAGVQTRNALVSELVERYYGLALASQVVQVRQQVVDGVRQHLNDAIALEKNGMIAHSERLYVEFKMAEAERELENAKLQEQTISAALANTLGKPTDYTPITTMFMLSKVEDLAFYQGLAADHNPLLNQVGLKRQLATENVRAKRAGFLPQIVAMGGVSFYNYQVANMIPRWAVGVGINLKIFDGLNREYTYSAAKQTVHRIESLEKKATDDIQVLIAKLYNQMMHYGNQMASIESSLVFAEEYLKSKNAAFLEGMSSSSDLVDAELNLAKVKTERLQAVYSYDLLLAKLLEAAGISDEFIHYIRRADARPITFGNN